MRKKIACFVILCLMAACVLGAGGASAGWLSDLLGGNGSGGDDDGLMSGFVSEEDASSYSFQNDDVSKPVHTYKPVATRKPSSTKSSSHEAYYPFNTPKPTHAPKGQHTQKPTHTPKAKHTTRPASTQHVQTFGEGEIDEDGEYSDKDNVALYIHTYGKLPKNYVTKKAAEKHGWISRQGNLADVLPGKSIGGDHFGNYDGQLPSKRGRTYTECDIDYTHGGRNGKRIIFSNDGLIFYTEDHYNTFEQLY